MKKILLVEDESKIANAVARGLKYEGFEVSIACDGEEALILGKENKVIENVLENFEKGEIKFD